MKNTSTYHFTIAGLLCALGISTFEEEKEIKSSGYGYNYIHYERPVLETQPQMALSDESSALFSGERFTATPAPVQENLANADVDVASQGMTAAFLYTLGQAVIQGEQGSMKEEKALSINGLSLQEMPPLDQDMINVTGENAAFRMLPHGKFEKDITVILPYDTTLLPLGYSEYEIYWKT